MLERRDVARKVARWLILMWASVALVVTTTGCKPAECTRMTECCAEIQGMEGVGQSCGSLTESTKNPDTCRAVLDTVKYMLEDRKKPVPAVCKLP